MRTRIVALAMVMTIINGAVPAFAHHSDVAYEQGKAIEVKNCTVVSYVWKNPHGRLTCDSKDQTGAVTRWTLESGSPSAMTQRGWTVNSVVPGDVIMVDVNPAKNGTKFGRLLRVTKADGTVLNSGTVIRDGKIIAESPEPVR